MTIAKDTLPSYVLLCPSPTARCDSGGSATNAKFYLSSVQSILSAQNNLSDYVGTLVATWRKVITTHTQQLFSGDRTDLLYDQIKQGKCLNIALTSTGLYDMELIMKKTIFGILIPKAWQSSNSGVYPVILCVPLPPTKKEKYIGIPPPPTQTLIREPPARRKVT